jgi:hypothetical protein
MGILRVQPLKIAAEVYYAKNIMGIKVMNKHFWFVHVILLHPL